MTVETLARWQFAITTVYHFFFVPLTIGLSGLVAVMQTIWLRTQSDRWLQMTKFFGRLMLINFAMGVVTGIVQEFQFGMNWSEYSRFVGDIFGAPLALEALVAFFLESTFLGLWIFGWDRLPRKIHLMCIWLVAIGTTLSAYFILAANSFMQNPVGFTFNEARGRAELTDIVAVLTNPVTVVTFPHQIFACYMTAGAFVAAVAGFWMVRDARRARLESLSDADRAKVEANSRAFLSAMRIGAITMMIAGIGVIISGDFQGKVMTDVQPMKMAAAEALYNTEQPAPFSIFTIGTLDGSAPLFSVEVPYLLSFLATGSFTGEVQGIYQLQAAYEATWGPGTYSPNIPLAYWTFRLMMGLGIAALAIGAVMLWVTRKGGLPDWLTHLPRFCLGVMIALPLLPLFANSFGWIFTETGRQPWVVFGLLPTAAGVSPATSLVDVWISLISFTAIYGILAVIEVRLLLLYIKKGLLPEQAPPEEVDDDAPLTFAY
ncbi:cytochrome ubiquinol oxidase subunit I [Naumannella halotolerans]|uniref:Cytochrome d ubiquinol oxidase subunit I n=1 Tax=Naumannella halotolerans TaxID=993414 RepID=A0A4R7J1S4_9ACTN|nr:cytochrome ubiquinol oxidase subunit I [Naumannella halotolerans]TDT30965.1 cytochrome d ubiquinol oxidase subunit I [Naumannella halotolerans]